MAEQDKTLQEKAEEEAVRRIELTNRQLTLATEVMLAFQEVIFQVAAYFQLALATIGVKAAPKLRNTERTTWAKEPTNLPGPQDLVSMELREVFRPSERSEQLQPPPSDDFRKYMLELGYSEYWASSYWAAHWRLPSIENGFEMFHRLRPGAVPSTLSFTRSDLERLLKRSDVLPAYIPKLVEIAYSPYTRVDVRRMYRLGILSESQVKEAYLDLGYNDERAGNLTRFTVQDTPEDEAAVTLSGMANAYLDGILERSDISEYIELRGYDAKTVTWFWKILNARKKEAARPKPEAKPKALTKTDVINGFNEGLLSDSEAISQLQLLGYTAIAARYIIDIEKAQARKKKAQA
jgi:hypothetical protein